MEQGIEKYMASTRGHMVMHIFPFPSLVLQGEESNQEMVEMPFLKYKRNRIEKATENA